MIGPAGVSYERKALTQWLRLRRTDPSTQCPLEKHDLYANLNLRSLIAAWAEAHARTSSDGRGATVAASLAFTTS